MFSELSSLVGDYRDWRDDDRYVWLRQEVPQLDGSVEKFDHLSKVAKRGNDVYRWRMGLRCADFAMVASAGMGRFVRGRVNRCNVVRMTLTVDPKRCALDDAWGSALSKAWNSFLTGLRQKFGGVEALRSWEAQRSGNPHVEAVLIFKDVDFPVVRYGSAYRVVEQYRERLCSGWSLGFVDVKAVDDDLRRAVWYVMKYVVKGDELTYALCWHFKKRSYSVSRGLLAAAADLMGLEGNSKSVQLDFLGNPVRDVWICIGLMPGSVMESVDRSRWRLRWLASEFPYGGYVIPFREKRSVAPVTGVRMGSGEGFSETSVGS